MGLRIVARRVVKGTQDADWVRDYWERQRDNAPDGATQGVAISELADAAERQLLLRSSEIEIGEYLMRLCSALDKKASRIQIFEAINCGTADRDTEMVRKYGDRSHSLICVLDLENSATKDDEITTRPLKWCHTMAFLRAMQTSPKLDRIVHDGANEFFNGAFGEYRERPLLERLAGRPW